MNYRKQKSILFSDIITINHQFIYRAFIYLLLSPSSADSRIGKKTSTSSINIIIIRFQYSLPFYYYLDLKLRSDFSLISESFTIAHECCIIFRAMVKLGNVSYVVYLVHWPVITLYKYYNDVKILDNIGIMLIVFLDLETSYFRSVRMFVDFCHDIHRTSPVCWAKATECIEENDNHCRCFSLCNYSRYHFGGTRHKDWFHWY